jgi:hypothetical protein
MTWQRWRLRWLIFTSLRWRDTGGVRHGVGVSSSAESRTVIG